MLAFVVEDCASVRAVDVRAATSAAGNDKRMVFVFDNTRLQPSGLVYELVVPPEWLDEIDEHALKSQRAFNIILLTKNSRYGCNCFGLRAIELTHLNRTRVID